MLCSQNPFNNLKVVSGVTGLVSGVWATFDLPPPAGGRFLAVSLNAPSRQLTLCELKVFGEAAEGLGVAPLPCT